MLLETHVEMELAGMWWEVLNALVLRDLSLDQ